MEFSSIARFFSPLGFDIFCLGKKFLVFNLISRNIKTKYRRSLIGVFWTLLSPLSMAALYYFVFKVILDIQIPHYLVFVFTGTLPWAFVAQSLMEGLESIVGNQGLISKIPLPIQVFPLVGTLTNMVTLLIAVPIMIVAALLSGIHLSISLVSLPFFLILFFLMTYFASLILAIAFVYLRDLRHALGLILQAWFYATPVIYREQMIPEKFKWIIYANPYGTLFTGMRRVLIEGNWPLLSQVVTPLVWIAVLFVLVLWIQHYFVNELAERL